jgi:hypothetical protein
MNEKVYTYFSCSESINSIDASDREEHTNSLWCQGTTSFDTFS